MVQRKNLREYTGSFVGSMDSIGSPQASSPQVTLRMTINICVGVRHLHKNGKTPHHIRCEVLMKLITHFFNKKLVKVSCDLTNR
jgi:hypothetical protein